MVILAFSFSITYFFFLPMINKHVKNNIRDVVRYANQYQPQEISVLFFPVGKWGKTFQSSLERETKCPQPPSITDIMSFYTNSKVVYEETNVFLREIENGHYPDIVLLVYHLDLPVNENKELKNELNKNYVEGPMFDRAKGAGIWRVKLKLYLRAEQ